MNQKLKKVSSLAVIVLALAFGFTSFVVIAKNDNAKNDKTSKTAQSQEKSKDKTVNLKNYQKPNETKGETNAKIHEEKIKEVNKELGQLVVVEKTAGNDKLSKEIQQVITEQTQVQEQTTDAIEQIETRGKIKTFLVGTDYKNLGQLRSDLVHNRNQIRKLTQMMNQIKSEGDQVLFQEQLETLMQERERIKTVITTNESSFSLLGWALRFFSNYEQTPINEQEENELTEEVEEAIEIVVANQVEQENEVVVPAENTESVTSETTESVTNETTITQ